MKRYVSLFLALAFMCLAVSASADPLFGGEHPLRLGFVADLNLPAGAGLGIVAHPKEDWAAPSLSLTYNGLSFGGRLGVKIDPLALKPRIPIGVFIDEQIGFMAQGNVPGHSSDLPSVGYDYWNNYLGLRLGRPNNFYFFIEGGPSYVAAHTGNFQTVVPSTKGLTVSDPSVSGWLVPTFGLGFTAVWP